MLINLALPQTTWALFVPSTFTIKIFSINTRRLWQTKIPGQVWEIRIIPSIRTVFPAVPMILVPINPEGTSELYNGVIRYKFTYPKVRWEKNSDIEKYRPICHCEHSIFLLAEGWSTSILKKIFSHIPVSCVERENKTIFIKSRQQWNTNPSISLETDSPMQATKLKMKKISCKSVTNRNHTID